MKFPFPTYNYATANLVDGTMLTACGFCRNALAKDETCRNFYSSLKGKPMGYFSCPYGFTTRTFAVNGELQALTGVIAHPRFGLANERDRAKKFPSVKVTRASIEGFLDFFRDIDSQRADAVAGASKVLPQAFHELRKLNAAILQHAEKELREKGDSSILKSIRSAAELMRNNFDILEALSNIEGIRALPNDSPIDLFNLMFKVKKVYEGRAATKGIKISVNGTNVSIAGSYKSFPTVPAVLLENAIKYGVAGTVINATISSDKEHALLSVENESDESIDADRCFDRGARFSKNVEGGGFGLYLAREIVDSHHGAIRCETRHKMVRMIVTLPLFGRSK